MQMSLHGPQWHSLFQINCSYALIQHWLTTPIKLLHYAEVKCEQQPISGKGTPTGRDKSEMKTDTNYITIA